MNQPSVLSCVVPFSSDVGAHAELGAHWLPGALIDGVAQYVDQFARLCPRNALGFAGKADQLVAVLIGDAADKNGLNGRGGRS